MIDVLSFKRHKKGSVSFALVVAFSLSSVPYTGYSVDTT